MASQTLCGLTARTKQKALRVQKSCAQNGLQILIYCTYRSLEDQARLYRQSRMRKEIEEKMREFRSRGYGFLADVIERVGPCSGPHVTNAAPGESWHNYGKAFDAVPTLCGKPIWNYQGQGKKYWDAYGCAVRKAGLYWAGDWKSFREYPHAQLSNVSNPLKLLTPAKARRALRGR